jgi:NADPH-dependent 2,4-dienoyl-CoA reductase/sulfur reductase-like enzyme
VIAAYFEQRGLVDFLNVSVGNVGAMVQPMYFPHLLGVYAANEVKAAVRATPVFTVHRILTPDEAEGILERGEADAITMVRALIADADWVAKAAAGKAHTIRRCVGCNQLCYGNLYKALPIQCVTNPAVGRESELGSGTLTPAPAPRRVMVVGGGPGGLEAAWVAAARGHSVTLFERSSALGGKIRLAQRLPGRAEIANFADWRIDECERRDVEIHLDTPVDLAMVQLFDPDVLIVATGGRPSVELTARGQLPVFGLDDPIVIDHEQATEWPERVGARVLIVDAIGHIEGAGLAELLAAAGHTVTLASPLMTLVLLDSATAASALRRACRAVAHLTQHRVRSPNRAGAATLVDTLSGRSSRIDVDTVVVRAHGDPVDELYHGARADGRAVWRIGDAVAVRPADRAIHEGHRVGRAV